MKIEFSTDNAAFDEEPQEEMGDIIHNISKKVREGIVEGSIKDINGNTIGHWEV